MFQLSFSIYCQMSSGSVFLICSFPGNFENCMFLLDSLKVFFLFILFSFPLTNGLCWAISDQCGYIGALGCSMSKWSSLYSPGDRHGCKKLCFIFPGREKPQYISEALLWKLHRDIASLSGNMETSTSHIQPTLIISWSHWNKISSLWWLGYYYSQIPPSCCKMFHHLGEKPQERAVHRESQSL